MWRAWCSDERAPLDRSSQTELLSTASLAPLVPWCLGIPDEARAKVPLGGGTATTVATSFSLLG
jgi:hypothetical protein